MRRSDVAGSIGQCESLGRRLGRLAGDQGGQVTLEHVLLMAAFVLPMYIVMMRMLEALNEYFGLLTFFTSLPFF